MNLSDLYNAIKKYWTIIRVIGTLRCRVVVLLFRVCIKTVIRKLLSVLVRLIFNLHFHSQMDQVKICQFQFQNVRKFQQIFKEFQYITLPILSLQFQCTALLNGGRKVDGQLKKGSFLFIYS